MTKVRIIAEIGSNYDNDFETAVAYIRAARDAGADMVKFQTLRKERIVAQDIRVGGRLERNPVYDLFTSLELPDDWHARLKQKADEMGIEFFSTPFYLEAVDLLERVGSGPTRSPPGTSPSHHCSKPSDGRENPQFCPPGEVRLPRSTRLLPFCRRPGQAMSRSCTA